MKTTTGKQFGDLSEFAKRDVEFFRSSDQNETAIYFTEVEYGNRKTAKAFFEVLRFGLGGGDHQLYVRFPNTDYFVEMIDGGFGSGRGDMLEASGKNVWKDDDNSRITIYSHNNDLILLMGESDFVPEFNFMKRVASYDKGNPFNQPYPNETFVNFKEIEEALSMKYLKIPENVRKIEYCYKTKDANPKYFVVDYPAYNFKYDNHRFFVIENENVKEFVIKSFVRYRDGGTTIITVTDENGTEHKFFSPTSLPEKTLCEKWDETELIEVSETEKQKLTKFLNLDLELNINDENDLDLELNINDDNDFNLDLEPNNDKIEIGLIWTPSTITEWLEERIEFTNTILNSAEVIDDNQKAQMVSDFTLANQNFTYCLKLYNERSNTENLRLFKNLALKLLFDISYEWDKVENRCVTIHEITFPTNEKNDFLPQKFWDTQKKWRDALSNIYNQILETNQ